MGHHAQPSDRSRVRSEQALAIWNDWACSTACDFDGQLDFYGLQRLAMECIVESGEVLIVRQPATLRDGLSIPMRIQVLEPDYIDTSRTGVIGESGGPIIDGIEFDKSGRRVAYWLFTIHPGSGLAVTLHRSGGFVSVRTPADRVLHVYRVDRPGQVRGMSWLATAIARLKDFDDYADAALMQQRVAACFAAFVHEPDGGTTAFGAVVADKNGQQIDRLQPGRIAYLKPGQEVSFAQPPRSPESGFTTQVLRRIAAGFGVTYEDLTGDYSQVNFSSARMARLAHWANVHEWRWHMLIPLMCNGVWRWAMQEVAAVQDWPTIPFAKWAAPPMPILEPDKEGIAYSRMIRNGLMTLPQVIGALGEDSTSQLMEIKETNELLDKLGIVLDCDPRRTNATGQAQQLGGGKPGSSGADDADESDEGDQSEGDNQGEDEEDDEEDEGENPADAAAG
jgi:lambda family phage portal protein